MAKCGKLTKLIKSSVMKKWTSFSRTRSSISAAANSSDDDDVITQNGADHFPVYVGKSRRRYLVDSETVANPIFRQLVERSSASEVNPSSSKEEDVVIACEVVLFEHLLWMLQQNSNCNASAADWQVSELVEFYAC